MVEVLKTMKGAMCRLNMLSRGGVGGESIMRVQDGSLCAFFTRSLWWWERLGKSGRLNWEEEEGTASLAATAAAADAAF